jgi:hypothetical protein
MTQTVSLGTKVKQIAGMHDTGDLTDWENEFVASVAERTRDGQDTTRLTEKQVETVERIWGKHFA